MTQLKSNGNGNRHGATDEKIEISTHIKQHSFKYMQNFGGNTL